MANKVRIYLTESYQEALALLKQLSLRHGQGVHMVSEGGGWAIYGPESIENQEVNSNHIARKPGGAGLVSNKSNTNKEEGQIAVRRYEEELLEKDNIIRQLKQTEFALRTKIVTLENQSRNLTQRLALIDGLRVEAASAVATAVAAAKRQSAQKISELQAQIEDLTSAKNSCEMQLNRLNSILDRVDKAELDRIKAEDLAIIRKNQEHKTQQQLEVECACHGEVENCARCFGKGRYIRDGYGRIV